MGTNPLALIGKCISVNTWRSAFLLLYVLRLCAGVADAETQTNTTSTSPTKVLQSLRKSHPRLLALDEDVSRTRELIRTDPLAAQWHAALRAQAEQVITEPPAEHKLIGPRLLTESRKALGRITLLGLLYRLDGDERFAVRAEKELRAVCAFPDWNPSHFLDTAEMSNAVG